MINLIWVIGCACHVAVMNGFVFYRSAASEPFGYNRAYTSLFANSTTSACACPLNTCFRVLSTLSRCGRGGQWEVALALLNETRQYGPSATASVYVSAAQACARAGKWEEATALMEVCGRMLTTPRACRFCLATLDMASQPSHALAFLCSYGEARCHSVAVLPSRRWALR